MAYDILIKNGTIMSENGQSRGDIAVEDGQIAKIAESIDASATKVIDATDLHILPGVIDTQVHFREPGNTHKEDLESGMRGAVMGGVTGVFEMPNTNPPTTSEQALQDKIDRAHETGWCNFAFFIGGTPHHGTDWHHLEQLPGCCGIKIFMGSSTGNLLVEQDEAIEEILSNSVRRVAVHCEDEARLKERFHLAEAEGHPRAHPIWRDEESALLATKRLLAIAKRTNHPVHVLHVTTKQEMAYLATQKDHCTVEATPQHLTLDDSAYETIGTRAQMNPPIRSADHPVGLWEGVANRTVDIIGSDHAPHTLEEKNKPYPQSPAGMPGVQTLVPIMLNHVNNGKLQLEDFVRLTSANPARLYGIKNKGFLQEGLDADITLIDMNKKWTITDDWMESKCGWTPYHNMNVQGKATHTIIHGNVVMENGTLTKHKARAYSFDF